MDNTGNEIMSDKEIQSSEEPEKIDVGNAYKSSPEKFVVDISSTHYSNVTYIQVAPRDVILDFLAFPGVRKGEEDIVSGVRIFLPHTAALRLSETLKKLLENCYNDGKIEALEFTRPEDVELSTEITRQTKEGGA